MRRSGISHTGVVRAPGPLHLAVVHGPDDVRLTALAENRTGILRQVGRYVERRVEIELAPTDAERVRRQLAAGELAAAVTSYFTAPHRWDTEFLHLGRIKQPGTTRSEPRQRELTPAGSRPCGRNPPGFGLSPGPDRAAGR